MKIRRKLFIALGIIAFFVAVTGIIGITYTKSINEKLLVVTTETSPTVETIDDLIIAIWKNAKTVEEFSNARSSEELNNLEREFEATHSNFVTIKEIAKNLLHETSLIGQLEIAIEKESLFIEKSYDILYLSKNTVRNRHPDTGKELQVLTRNAAVYSDEAANSLEEISLRVYATNKKANEESLRAVKTTIRILLLMTLISMFSAGLIGLYLSRSIIRPINRLVDATKKLGKGDFDVVVKETLRNDEISHFTKTFNNMVASLRKMVAKNPDLKKYFTIEGTEKPITEYILEPGSSYMFKGESSSPAYDIAEEKLRKGFQVLGVIRTNPNELIQKYNLQKAKFVWLKDTKDKDHTIASSLTSLTKIVTDFISKQDHPLIILDRVDYLITKHGFPDVLKFITSINDFIMSSKAIMIIPMDPAFMNERNLSFLEKELKELDFTPQQKGDIPDELREILDFIKNRKTMSKTTSFKDIGKEFNITAPTTQKRVLELEKRGQIRISKQGRNKVIYPLN